MNTQLVIDLTPNQAETLETLAKRHGYEDVAEYVRVLISEAAEMDIEDDFDDEVDDGIDPVESFRRAWQDVLDGNVMTWEEFEQSMREDDDDSR